MGGGTCTKRELELNKPSGLLNTSSSSGGNFPVWNRGAGMDALMDDQQRHQAGMALAVPGLTLEQEWRMIRYLQKANFDTHLPTLAVAMSDEVGSTVALMAQVLKQVTQSSSVRGMLDKPIEAPVVEVITTKRRVCVLCGGKLGDAHAPTNAAGPNVPQTVTGGAKILRICARSCLTCHLLHLNDRAERRDAGGALVEAYVLFFESGEYFSGTAKTTLRMSDIKLALDTITKIGCGAVVVVAVCYLNTNRDKPINKFTMFRHRTGNFTAAVFAVCSGGETSIEARTLQDCCMRFLVARFMASWQSQGDGRSQNVESRVLGERSRVCLHGLRRTVYLFGSPDI
jgi:hypothetical protein